jgi:hypothetical protein
MVHRGDNSNRLWHSWFDGDDWTTPVQIPDHFSQSGPSITEFDGNLHMVHRGDSSNRLWHSWFDGDDWTTPVQIPRQSSQSAPAIATFNNLLHLVHRGDSTNQLWYAQFSSAPQQWTPNVPIPNQSSKGIAAIAPLGSRLYMSHIGDVSNRIWVSYTDGFPLSEIRVGFKILSGAPVSNWLANMQQIFATMNYTVTLVDIEDLNLPPLEVVNIGECVQGEITEEQRQLFQFRRNLDCDVIAVYFVFATNPPANGCAAHREGVPACIVASVASPWTLAHEVGHVLGLNHVDDDTRLMYGGGTWNIQDPPPELAMREAVTMAESPYSREGQ